MINEEKIVCGCVSHSDATNIIYETEPSLGTWFPLECAGVCGGEKCFSPAELHWRTLTYGWNVPKITEDKVPKIGSVILRDWLHSLWRLYGDMGVEMQLHVELELMKNKSTVKHFSVKLAYVFFFIYIFIFPHITKILEYEFNIYAHHYMNIIYK